MKFIVLIIILCLTACMSLSDSQSLPDAVTLRVATFNVSMEAGNYVDPPVAGELRRRLQEGTEAQIAHVAEILQRLRPDIVLLNEFDFAEPAGEDARLFVDNYLKQSQSGQRPIDYPYVYVAPVNTGELFPVDLNGDGERSLPEDAYGFGDFPGHYGMVLLSRYPIETAQVRSFRHFLWSDMPGALMPTHPGGEPYYAKDAWQQLRLSSKSHWHIPVTVQGRVLHILASHPTPPVFDGPENRNGYRNHDEIRLWRDYLSGTAEYLYDDRGDIRQFPADAHFVMLGDLNASPHEGDSVPGAIVQLLEHPRVVDPRPTSKGGYAVRPDNPYSATHTTSWGMRVDYVLPSRTLQVRDAGVFWPVPDDPLNRLVSARKASSDHRLVWVDVRWPSHDN